VRVELIDESYDLNPVTHFWDFGDGFTSTQAEPKHVYTTPGWQTIIHRTTNACNKMEMSAQTIFLVANISPLPRFYANPNEVCPGDAVMFDNFTMKADSMVLDFGDGSKEIFTQGFMPHIFHTYENPGRYHTKLYVYNRCSADTAGYVVNVLQPAKAEILMKDTTIFAGTTLNINKNTSGAVKHLWQSGINKKDSSTANSLTIKFDSSGSYKVYLLSVNDAECLALDSVTINVLKLPTALNKVADEDASILIYPNPAQHQLHIKYVLEKSAEVALTIYDMNGREVKQIPLQKMEAGTHEWSQSISELSSGMYYCTIQINSSVVHHKLVKQ
jgi:PKD repeat protein